MQTFPFSSGTIAHGRPNRLTLKMLVLLDVVCGSHQCESRMTAAVIAGRERFSQDRSYFMLLRMTRIMHDLVNARFGNLVARFIDLCHFLSPRESCLHHLSVLCLFK